MALKSLMENTGRWLRGIALIAWIPALLVAVASCHYTQSNYEKTNAAKVHVTDVRVYDPFNAGEVIFSLINSGRDDADNSNIALIDLASKRIMYNAYSLPPLVQGAKPREITAIIPARLKEFSGELLICIKHRTNLDYYAFNFYDINWNKPDNRHGGVYEAQSDYPVLADARSMCEANT